IGGAFAPTIGQGLLEATGSTNGIAVYIIVMSALSCIAALLLQDVPRRALGIDHQEEQEHYARLRLGKVEPYSGTRQLNDASLSPDGLLSIKSLTQGISLSLKTPRRP